MRSAEMPFILTGFRQDMGFRVFAFERRETDRSRMEFTVKADLALIRRYDIRVQELPLLCRSFLESREGLTDAAVVTYKDAQALTYSEDEMRACAVTRTAAKNEAARRRKPPRRPAGETPGAAWRG
jgi:hypothetical protein